MNMNNFEYILNNFVFKEGKHLLLWNIVVMHCKDKGVVRDGSNRCEIKEGGNGR